MRDAYLETLGPTLYSAILCMIVVFGNIGFQSICSLPYFQQILSDPRIGSAAYSLWIGLVVVAPCGFLISTLLDMLMTDYEYPPDADYQKRDDDAKPGFQSVAGSLMVFGILSVLIVISGMVLSETLAGWLFPVGDALTRKLGVFYWQRPLLCFGINAVCFRLGWKFGSWTVEDWITDSIEEQLEKNECGGNDSVIPPGD